MEFVTVQPSDAERIGLARELFAEYQRELGIDLSFQGFEEEIAELPGKYGPPAGVLVLVLEGGYAIACGALRDLGDGFGELKRIYVRPEGRRRGLAKAISEHLIDFARRNGYEAVRLDTLRRLPGAFELYDQLGFKLIEPYNVNNEPDILYMELALAP